MKQPNSQHEAMNQAERHAIGKARILSEDDIRLRASLIAEGIAPGTPLYLQRMGAHVVEGTPVFSAKFLEQHAGKEFVITDEVAEVSENAWSKAYADARASHAAGEPLIRTVCKIAARILFVLLLVGAAVAVMV